MTKRKPKEEVSKSRRKIALLRWHPELRDTPEVTPTPGGPKRPPPGVAWPFPEEPTVADRTNLPTDRVATLADYDGLLGQPGTWTDAKTREQVQKEILDNEAKQDENAVRRRALFTAKAVEEREEKYDDLVFSHLTRFADFCAELVEDDKKDDTRKRARGFVSTIRKAIADAIGGRKRE